MLRFSPFLMVAALSFLVACSASTPRSAGKVAPASAAPESTAGTGASTLGLGPLEFGPYLVDPPAGLAATQLSVEYGYLDVRQRRATADFSDYRLKLVGVLAATDHLPATPASDCAAVDAAPPSQALAGKLVVTAPLEKTLNFNGMARFADESDGLAFAVDAELAATATLSTLAAVPVAVRVEGALPPEPGSLQIAGAYDASIGPTMSLSDMNAALVSATEPLLLADVGTATGYNLVVVTLYGGAAATVKQVRCYLKPGGQASLAPEVLARLLPLKAVIAHFAAIQLVTDGGVSVWTAAIAGQGSEDLTVP